MSDITQWWESNSIRTPKTTLMIVLVSCVATIGGFLFGFDSGVINGTVDGLRIAFDSAGVGTGFNVASMLLGCAFGAFFRRTFGGCLWAAGRCW